MKQGGHAIRASEADHETLDISFKFENRTQVLYLNDFLRSASHAGAGRAGQETWEESETLLKRAAAVHATNIVMVYMQAILDYRRGDYSEAASQLESLLSGGSSVTYVYLFLADLYQYNLGRPELARKALTDYLRQSDNPDVRKRLDDMRTASAK